MIFNDYFMLDLGGITCEMIKIGGCHSDDSTIFYVPEEKYYSSEMLHVKICTMEKVMIKVS